MSILNAYAKDIQSQSGEDGVLAEIFKRIGTQSKWCVELGALNGTHHSNTWALLNQAGWSGVLIEADPTYFERLQENYANNERVHCVNAFVSFEGEQSLDSIFSRTPMPERFDLLSLDIDGNEYHVWDSLQTYRPRVLVVEFNPTIPNDIEFIQPRDMRVQQGSSLQALMKLAARKGYGLAVVLGMNAVFVDLQDFTSLGFAPLTPQEAYTDTHCFTRLYQLYDGTLVLDGCTTLLWHNLPIDAEAIQMIKNRRMVGGMSAHGFVRSLKYWARKTPLYAPLQRMRGKLK